MLFRSGSSIALPNDPLLEADLAAPIFEVGPRGVKIESKEDIVKRLSRSPDRGDAVVMAWYVGQKNLPGDRSLGFHRKPKHVEVITRRSMRDSHEQRVQIIRRAPYGRRM